MSSRPSAFLIASYPRSGSTWVRTFLSGFLAGVSDPDAPGGPSVLHNANYNRPLLEFDYLSERKPINMRGRDTWMVKTHAKSYPINLDISCVGIIHLVRHPIDVFASGVNYYYRRNQSACFFDHRVRSFADLEAAGDLGKQLDYFLDNVGFLPTRDHMGTWVEHTHFWLDRARTHAPVLTIRFEDMLSDTDNQFKRIVEHLGANYDAERAATVQRELVSFQLADKTKVVWRRGSDYMQGKVTDDQRQQVQELFGGAFSRLGYAA